MPYLNSFKSLILFLLFCLTLQAQVPGCTDPLSKNFNPQATLNDGSCSYASASVEPMTSVELPDEVEETSGLIRWGGNLITHNDDTDTNLYALDTLTGAIVQKLAIAGAKNQDWEELAQDRSYIYIGDFGNNHRGNRSNLNIIRVHKDSLTAGNAKPGYINFSYSNQALSAKGENNTDFDCEAMIVSLDSIYLFTKQWNSKQTSLYALPKTPGTHTAEFKGSLNVSGLITGATYLEEQQLVVLLGYSKTLKPFFYLLYDFKEHDFFSGNKRKIKVKLPFHQTEGITTTNGLQFYITNENFESWPVKIKQAAHLFDLSPYLKTYIDAPDAGKNRF